LRGSERPRQLNSCSINSHSFLCDYIKKNIKHPSDKNYEATLNANILAFSATFNRTLLAVNGTANTFISKYEGWLDTKFYLPKNEKKNS
jgi:hypothetical protein